MDTNLLPVALILLVIVNAMLIFLLRGKKGAVEFSDKISNVAASLARLEPLLKDEALRTREENQRAFKENREELGNSFRLLSETQSKAVSDLSNVLKNQLELFAAQLRESVTNSENRLKEIRETMEGRLKGIQDENSRKLDEMRKVVDEKLQETVEKRFNESFKLISDRLELVHKGLGEMQNLASGVGDLKKVLTNIKTRGNLGEIQLGAILEQFLSVGQYEQNAVVKENSQERVEFAIRLPGRNRDNQPVLLPVDSKFPIEDYQRLMEAYDNIAGYQPKEVESLSKQFENAVRKNARDIREKYINPPLTTDFAVMFVPTEGLYAEILRRAGLFESLQKDYKVTVVGPTNLVAFLSSLQMGFQTLAIEKRSSEVWEILGAVKTEFRNFGSVLEKTRKKLQEATNVIDTAGARSRAIERKLRSVHELPPEKSALILGSVPEQEEDTGLEEQQEISE